MTKAETIFAHELSLIHDKTIRDFVIICFDKLCPDYLWTCPCSTTGKYHPQVSLGVGGLVRHTKLAVWWGLHLATALGNSPELRGIPQNQLLDEIIATLLLHDMIKNGKGLNAQGRPLEKGVTGTHGVTLANKINTHPDIDLTDNSSYWRIIEGVRSHMGIWTTDEAYRPNTILNPASRAFANLIHLADYCASRKVDDMYSKFEREKNEAKLDATCKKCISKDCERNTNDSIQQTTEQISQSPPCPGVRPTESCQTTTAENGQ